MTTTTATVDRAVPDSETHRADTTSRRIRAEYLEMPGLTLTVPQACRLWCLSPAQSERLLSELVDGGFLIRDARGAYRRYGSPRWS
jgi:Fic family protein